MVGVRSVPPHKAQATITSLQQIQTNDVRNYPHSHRKFDKLNLNIFTTEKHRISY